MLLKPKKYIIIHFFSGFLNYARCSFQWILLQSLSERSITCCPGKSIAGLYKWSWKIRLFPYKDAERWLQTWTLPPGVYFLAFPPLLFILRKPVEYTCFSDLSGEVKPGETQKGQWCTSFGQILEDFRPLPKCIPLVEQFEKQYKWYFRVCLWDYNPLSLNAHWGSQAPMETQVQNNHQNQEQECSCTPLGQMSYVFYLNSQMRSCRIMSWWGYWHNCYNLLILFICKELCY